VELIRDGAPVAPRVVRESGRWARPLRRTLRSSVVLLGVVAALLIVAMAVFGPNIIWRIP